MLTQSQRQAIFQQALASYYTPAFPRRRDECPLYAACTSEATGPLFMSMGVLCELVHQAHPDVVVKHSYKPPQNPFTYYSYRPVGHPEESGTLDIPQYVLLEVLGIPKSVINLLYDHEQVNNIVGVKSVLRSLCQ